MSAEPDAVHRAGVVLDSAILLGRPQTSDSGVWAPNALEKSSTNSGAGDRVKRGLGSAAIKGSKQVVDGASATFAASVGVSERLRHTNRRFTRR